MTLSTNPTYILSDSSGQNFACVLRMPTEAASEGAGPKFEVESFKKKHTLVLRDAERSGVRDGKQGHVAKGIDEVMIIPASVERLMELSIRARAELVQREGEVKEGEEICQACGTRGEDLLRCRGCECVWYCDKSCQTKGWSDGGHKTDCKVFKAVSRMDLGDRGFNLVE
ncbi:hypothetical protein PVAG01_06397 [Phlyctema vagabunda]|uniref:MYND-type domain-containing protein n=1 Tax=Phlyctema vagabunda TaxID=108571 RepID=A0ABR4PGV7_9HELO